MESIARQDIKKLLGEIKTISASSSEEGTAFLILNMFDLAKGRLVNKDIIRIAYSENNQAPEGLRSIAGRYVSGVIDQAKAEKEIDEMKQAYQKVLSEEYSLKGSKPSAIFLG
jgi:hypothetical protein